MSRLAYTDGMADDRTDTRPHTPDEHYCEHAGCSAWGGFGFAASTSTPMRWWCHEHYPYWTEEERKRRNILPIS